MENDNIHEVKLQATTARVELGAVVRTLREQGIDQGIILSELLKIASDMAPACDLAEELPDSSEMDEEVKEILGKEKTLKDSEIYKKIVANISKQGEAEGKRDNKANLKAFDEFFDLYEEYLEEVSRIYGDILSEDAFDAMSILPWGFAEMELYAIDLNPEGLEKTYAYLDAIHGLRDTHWDNGTGRKRIIGEMNGIMEDMRRVYDVLHERGTMEKRKLYKAAQVNGTQARFHLMKAQGLGRIRITTERKPNDNYIEYVSLVSK